MPAWPIAVRKQYGVFIVSPPLLGNENAGSIDTAEVHTDDKMK
jgi:hypothetical protein